MSNYILIDGTLYHHGIKGQKWGLRRYQNEDGSLTPEGREHYGYGNSYAKKQSFKDAKARYKEAKTNERQVFKNQLTKSFADQDDSAMDRAMDRRAKAKEEYKLAKKTYREDKEIRKAEQKAWKQQRRDYIKSKSIGEKFLTGFTMTPFALYNYNSLMAAGETSKFAAYGKSQLLSLTGMYGNVAYSTIIANKQKEKY